MTSSLMKAFEAMIPERDEVDSSAPHTFMLLEMLQAAEVNPINGQFVIPYARRYVRHSWTLNMSNDHEMIEAYPNEPTPSYPDFIDAFRCTFQRYAQLDVFGQFQSALNIQPSDLAELDRLIRPSLWTYPYPIEEPPPCR